MTPEERARQLVKKERAATTQKKAPRRTKKDLTAFEKAEMVLQKEIHEGAPGINRRLSKEFDVPESQVKEVTYESLNPIGREIYASQREKLKDLAFDTALRALEKVDELIHGADDPKYLQGVVAGGKFADQIYRLETNQPTEIHHQVTVEANALEFIRLLMQRMNEEEAIEAFRVANLEPLVPQWRHAEIIQRIESGNLKLLPPPPSQKVPSDTP